MGKPTSRRTFVRSAATLGAAVGIGDLSLLMPARAGTGRRRDAVQFHPAIEPLVRLLEEAPRERVLEEFAARIEKGTTHTQVLAALHLAGIRNIPPRPDVGFKFHAVLVLHSAHLASMAAEREDRWLPIFFALDFFKAQQAYDVRESDWTMPAVDEAKVPELVTLPLFIKGMDEWEDEAADVAAAGLVRSTRPGDVFEQLAWYGMRDFRDIGHKTIYTANAWRTLEYIGQEHAEPMVRSLTYALLNHHEEPNPARSKLEADAPWRHNLELVVRIDDEWAHGEVSSKATTELLSTLRSAEWTDASGHVVQLLNAGVAPQSIHDALFVGAAELLLRQPNIVSLHGMTATNALAYLYRTSTRDRTRRMLLLQNASLLVQFRDYLKDNASWGDARIDAMYPSPSGAVGREALDEIFELVGVDGETAAGRTLAYLGSSTGRSADFMAAAREWIMLKSQNGHHYKFSSAVMEDYGHISRQWRDRYLAASVHYLRGSKNQDNAVAQQTRELLG